MSSISLQIPQKGGGAGTHLGETWHPNGECSSIDHKRRFTEAFRKDDSIWDSQVENCCSEKSEEAVSW